MKQVKVTIIANLESDNVSDALQDGFDNDAIKQVIKKDFNSAKLSTHFVDSFEVIGVETVL